MRRRTKKINGRKLVMMNASEDLYKKIDSMRKKFKEVNGIDITLVQAGEFFARNVKLPNVPNLLKNDTTKKKS